ncbi:glycosyltransferase family 4 protein [Flavobacterium jejuense]|uniref:Glycosyltransferase family 4 protein n=1 Tax=Flavobacterium jejuense TaxID=1544455 RepID=A0ABX0IMU4_9FLAO|nr:glycosyltransferase family 4 protein [Flavobacterium jejuense]NHN24355.1 glycosyltransferase family 4 protein [Flavobacterium jejuense]
MKPSKKILIISYYWPPAGGPGVQRWLKFVKYLPDFGIEPHVYIPENPNYPLTDEKLIREVSESTIVVKKKIFEPYGLAAVFSKNKTKKISSGIIPNQKKQTFLEKLMLWIRGNLFIPDARVFWVKPSVKFLKKYLQENEINTVITTGPPHSLHLIGLQLKKELNIKWITDFRDPWTTIGYHKQLKLSNWAAKKHEALEKEVLNSCDTIIVTSENTKKEFKALSNQRIEVITNGYDFEKVAKKPMDTQFTLAHIGSFLSERNPKILWQSLSELILENRSFAENFQLKLIGAVSNEVLESIEKYNLQTFVHHLGYVSHEEALQQQKSSQVLLLVEIDSEETKCIIPGKLFEYMVSERPIIAIGPNATDFEKIIKETNSGSFFNYYEKEALKDQILKYFNLYLENDLKSHPIGLQQYSRKRLTENLASLVINH